MRFFRFFKKAKALNGPVNTKPKQEIIRVPIGSRVPRNTDIDQLIDNTLENSIRRIKKFEEALK
ncbi:hypothetical protein [Halalkalibacter akibai]|uniref:Uncharacterized protein n=1 Tax=Halalkalibacter akibai (strain ATCC 43226 / DSM 21942 / CIP 109018 / JCM 9157 / 1139) TaxID=1236973 RepID=W4QXP3_HALA3|nr:hypothetical protein [Halalkalibacter akibai]GAE36677.1 hypothetical protein JCM9157_3886 [Halalkalibacter akibai JCM 9157]